MHAASASGPASSFALPPFRNSPDSTHTHQTFGSRLARPAVPRRRLPWSTNPRPPISSRRRRHKGPPSPKNAQIASCKPDPQLAARVHRFLSCICAAASFPVMLGGTTVVLHFTMQRYSDLQVQSLPKLQLQPGTSNLPAKLSRAETVHPLFRPPSSAIPSAAAASSPTPPTIPQSLCQLASSSSSSPHPHSPAYRRSPPTFAITPVRLITNITFFTPFRPPSPRVST
ncbi:hypothetical protein PaG_05145 [Moesziomyces aphidis]|uniref:Uncharacterized protein n=1 Tax=Moesziomyces aphidis TaxID=84754 RepID=W3VHP2_MOEAP|nr:hypothetical protein PaG_05145 [Moesziomyces aphidis]